MKEDKNIFLYFYALTFLKVGVFVFEVLYEK